jgi:hypothetical protein
MTRAEEYRHLANKVRAQAAGEESPILRAEWEILAECYAWRNKRRQANKVIRFIVGILQGKIKRTIQ